jgi:beta-glucanase (GH16 family)
MDGITANTKYLGDSSTTDWVMSGQAVSYNNNVLLTMAPDTVGTLLASSTYMWYGNVKATFKTSRGQGVVTAFILLSDVKDEIDYEFVGTDLSSAQSNYYFQGIPNCEYFGRVAWLNQCWCCIDDNELNISLSDTFNNYHTYEIDWTPDSITWLVDGQVGRTKKRSDTWNATSNQWDFPQTPARVQLSLWPAGLSSNGQGTVDWAGGLVDWNSADIQNNGYYYATFQSVTISCFNGTSAPGTNSGKSYTYNNDAGTNNTVVDGNDDTVLSSFLATGTNKTIGAVASSASGSSAPSTSAQTIPGLTGSGPGTDSHGNSGSSGSSDSGSSSSAASAGSTATDSSSGSAQTSSGSDSFSQGDGSSSSSSSSKSGADKLGGQERVMKGSIFAGIVAVVAMMAL